MRSLWRLAGRFRLACIGLLLPLVTCGQANPAPEAVRSVPSPACGERRFEGALFIVCTFDRKRDELRLAWKRRDGPALRSFAALETSLGQDARRLRFAMNAGMYDADGAPVGLYVEQGRVLRPLNRRSGYGNFHMKPNGVFAEDAGGVRASDSATIAREAPRLRWATQSGPMLVIDGALHPRFDANGQSQLVRNGVGVRDPNTAYFVISEDAVSFGRFARFFRDALGCRNALYLDGSVSSLWDPDADRQDPSTELGPMIVVLRRDSPHRESGRGRKDPPPEQG